MVTYNTIQVVLLCTLTFEILLYEFLFFSFGLYFLSFFDVTNVEIIYEYTMFFSFF